MSDLFLPNPWTWAIVGYLLGSIPFGLILAGIAGVGDIRKIGSGNIGSTNVLRTGRKGLAAATLLLDSGKGAVAVLLALQVCPGTPAGILAGAFAVLGHLYPAWLGFKGGKGVATMLGVALALHWPSGIAFAFVWLMTAWLGRYSSLAGMLAAVAAPVPALLHGNHAIAAALWGLAMLVLFKHRDNIARLRAGTESKIGAKSGG